MEKRALVYSVQHVPLQMMIGEQLYPVVIAEGTGLGYWWPEGEACCRLQHVGSGTFLRVRARTEDAARACVESVAGLADWTLSQEEFFQVYNEDELFLRLFAVVDRLIRDGWPLERVP